MADNEHVIDEDDDGASVLCASDNDNDDDGGQLTFIGVTMMIC